MPENYIHPQEIKKIKNEIYSKVPFIHNVKVDIKKIKHGKFETIVSAQIPATKPIVAIKKSEKLKKALEKSTQAILKQAQKYKDNIIHLRRAG